MVNLKCVNECAASSLNEKLVQALSERDAYKKQIESLVSELAVTRKEVGVWRTEAKREEGNAKRWFGEWSHILGIYKDVKANG